MFVVSFSVCCCIVPSFMFTSFRVEFMPCWIVKYKVNFTCSSTIVWNGILLKQKVSILMYHLMLP